MSPPRRRFLPLIAGLGLALLAVAAAEGVLRALGFGQDPERFYFARLGERVIEPDMFAPDAGRFFTLRPGYRHSTAHAGPNALSDWPFRGRPLAPAPPDLWSIAVLGDSCVYGLPLPANVALPALLDDELAAALGEPGALVANLGVPGYTTVQIGALLDDVLARHAPDEVVLYPAAWNDQAPSLGRNDVELRADASGLSGLVRRSALAHALRSARAPEAGEAAAESGPRVPEEAVEGEVRAAIRACRAAGAGVTVIVPPHPEHCRPTHGRLFRDADSVRRAAAAEGVQAVDLQATLGDDALEDLYFSDLVHPAPEGQRALARAVAEVLLARAPPRAASDSGLRVAGFEPRAVPELGDVPLLVHLEGWSAADAPPSISVGGAALLDVVPAGPGAVRGTLPRLAAGEARVVAQLASGAAAAAEPLRVLAPVLAVLPGAPPRVRVTSRPGDRARVLLARGLRAHAKWSVHGALQLDETTFLRLDLALTLGADGTGEVEVPALEGEGPFHLQAMILPPGEPQESLFSLWSAAASWPER